MLTFTGLLNSTIETLEKYVKYVKVNKKKTDGVLIINFEHISHLFLVFQVNVDWVWINIGRITKESSFVLCSLSQNAKQKLPEGGI